MAPSRSSKSTKAPLSSISVLLLLFSSLQLAEPFSSSSFLSRPKSLSRVSPVGQTTFSLTTTLTVDSSDILDQQYDPNEISPETKTIGESMRFYFHYVVQSIVRSQQEKKKRLEETVEKKSRRKSFRESMRKLNEQRKNLVTLAGYTSHIVIPSFTFLFLGALTTSVVPMYEAKCIQLVATLHPSKAKLIEALLGLVVSSTLASLFTGLRGSLFWLAGA